MIRSIASWKRFATTPMTLPQKVEDYEGMKDDRWVDQRYPGTERLSDDHL